MLTMTVPTSLPDQIAKWLQRTTLVNASGENGILLNQKGSHDDETHHIRHIQLKFVFELQKSVDVGYLHLLK